MASVVDARFVTPLVVSGSEENAGSAVGSPENSLF